MSVGRDEGLISMLKRSLHYLKTRLIDSGDVIWFLRYTDPEKRPHRPSERVLIKAETPEQHELLDRYRPLLPEVREAREAAGAERWFVIDEEGDVGCTFWTYSKYAVVSDRPLITLPLPEAAYQLEDIYTPAKRRSGRLAAEALDILYRELAPRGVEFIVTKIDVENTMVLKSAYAYEWTEIAKVRGTRLLRTWTRWKVEKLHDFYPALSELESSSTRK